MINPPTRPYLPEELEMVLRSQIVETEKLSDIKLENEVVTNLDVVQNKKVIFPMAVKKTLVILGIAIIAGAIIYIIYIRTRKNNIETVSKSENSEDQSSNS